MVKFNSKQWIALIAIVCIIILVVRIGTRGPVNKYTISSSSSGEVEGLYKVYFAAATDVCLLPEYRLGAGTINERLQTLLKGPQSSHLVGIMPEETRVISLQLEDDILYINFSEELITNHRGGSSSELMTIYGLVNTMTEIPEIDQIQILVAGRKVGTIAGHVDVLEPLSRDISLVGLDNISADFDLENID